MGDSRDDTVLGTVKAYQAEMMARGVDAVRRSRGEIREDRKAEDTFMIWGHPAKPTPEETVKLEDWL